MANRKNWWHTILRWLGLKAEEANDKLDNAVDIETKLKRKIVELNDKKKAILDNPVLAKAIGLAEELEQELVRERKSYASRKYDQTISQLMKNNNKDQARQVLMRKKEHDNKIEFIKESMKSASLNKDKLQKDLATLETNILKIKGELEELKQRNRYAEQSNQVLELMTEIEGISVGDDADGIVDEIRDREREALGRRSEYDRKTIVQSATRDANNAELDAELENYK